VNIVKTTKLFPPTYLLIAVLAILVLHFGLPGIIIVPPLWRLLGIAFIVIGVTISSIAEGKFHKAGTTVMPFTESSVLVTNGLYEFSRNPMYLGFVVVLLGEAILLGSLSPYIIVILFWIVMEKLFIEAEERMLEAKFGNQWTEYKTSVGRFIISSTKKKINQGRQNVD
jgi:protein-S-isoprenylcysteine O-methyltransferase Ste14